jgi:hypothetical protein
MLMVGTYTTPDSDLGVTCANFPDLSIDLQLSSPFFTLCISKHRLSRGTDKICQFGGSLPK